MIDVRKHEPGRVKYLVCVDGSPQSRVAVRFAGLRAKNTTGYVVLLTVLEPAEFQHWMAVEDMMQEERREEAERFLQELAAEVNELAGVMPVLSVRSGRAGDEILAAIDEDPSISFAVIGAAPDENGQSKLITWLASQVAGKLNVPLVIVPGNLSDEQLAELT